MENNKNLLNFGLVLGLSIIISAIIGATTFYNLRSTNFISTTGSARKAVLADKAKWTSNITHNVTIDSIKDGYKKMEINKQEFVNFLLASGIKQEEITLSPIMMNEVYEQYPNTPKKYNLSQNIEINSNDVRKIDTLSKSTNSLVIDKGILFSGNYVEYYYSKLPETRIELLGSAVADAKARANELATAGGKKLGILKSASSGVVQVMSPNSQEVSDYGVYDTSKIEKEVMVTVKASFTTK